MPVAPDRSCHRRSSPALLCRAGVVGTSTAVTLFALVNAPALLAPDVFLHGLDTEIAHAVTKHIIVWHGWYSHFLFHWTTSLWPGLGPALAVAGLAGALLVVADRRASPPAIRLVLVFALIWYLLHELSPMKPFMAIERHMTVMGGLFAVLAAYLVDRICRHAPQRWRAAIATGIVGIVAAPAAVTTLAIARPRRTTPATRSSGWREALDGPDAVDWYATFPGYAHYPPLTAIGDLTQYVVVVQETADRFVKAGTFPGQPDIVRRYAEGYGELLARPAIVVEFRPRDFSYRNVPLRVVALRSTAARLQPCSPGSGRCRRRAYAGAWALTRRGKQDGVELVPAIERRGASSPQRLQDQPPTA